MLLITPQAANKTIGQGGFQEVEQMALFRDMVCYQEELRDASRVCEVLNRVIEKAWRGSAPAQMNIPRDFWTQVIDVELPQIVELERAPGGAESVAKAAALLSEAKFPVILSGAGRRYRATRSPIALRLLSASMRRSAAAISTMTAFPARTRWRARSARL